MFATVAQAWIRDNSENNKLKYAITRTLQSAGRALGKYQEDLEEINIENCHTLPDGVIDLDSRGQYKFDKPSLLARNKARAALFDKPIEVEVYFATEVPEGLPQETAEAFAGFVIQATDPA
jgi:hypothetical protein